MELDGLQGLVFVLLIVSSLLCCCWYSIFLICLGKRENTFVTSGFLFGFTNSVEVETDMSLRMMLFCTVEVFMK